MKRDRESPPTIGPCGKQERSTETRRLPRAVEEPVQGMSLPYRSQQRRSIVGRAPGAAPDLRGRGSPALTETTSRGAGPPESRHGLGEAEAGLSGEMGRGGIEPPTLGLRVGRNVSAHLGPAAESRRHSLILSCLGAFDSVDLGALCRPRVARDNLDLRPSSLARRRSSPCPESPTRANTRLLVWSRAAQPSTDAWS